MAITTLPLNALSSDVNNIGANFRNLIINGDMSIAQRGTSHSIGSGAGYIIDRWRDGAIYDTVAPTGAFTVSQSTDVPSGQGFVSSQKWDCTTAQTSLTEQGWGVQQRIEAQNLTHLAFGTSSAKTLTLTFWIKSNKTGTYGIEVRSHDASRQFISSYTIDSANTWEKKTITITGDTSGSGIANDNGIGFWVRWIWSAGTTIDGATLNSWTATATEIAPTGQVNLADSTSNELYWTGAQLEVGTTASDFEFLPYDVNFNRCQRYYFEEGNSANGYVTTALNTSASPFRFYFPITMRTAPSGTVVGTVNTDLKLYHNGLFRTLSNVYFANITANSTKVEVDSAGKFDLARGGHFYFATSTGKFKFDAEL